MIKLLRVDDRLVHGQVAMVWTSYLKVDTLVVANDHCAKDAFAKMALNLAKPPQVDMPVLSLEEAAAYLNDEANSTNKIFVVVESTKDAVKLAETVTDFSDVILGGIRKSGNKMLVERQVFLDADDIANCKKLTEMGKSVQIQVVPSEKVLNMTEAERIWAKNK